MGCTFGIALWAICFFTVWAISSNGRANSVELCVWVTNLGQTTCETTGRRLRIRHVVITLCQRLCQRLQRQCLQQTQWMCPCWLLLCLWVRLPCSPAEPPLWVTRDGMRILTRMQDSWDRYLTEIYNLCSVAFYNLCSVHSDLSVLTVIYQC